MRKSRGAALRIVTGLLLTMVLLFTAGCVEDGKRQGVKEPEVKTIIDQLTDIQQKNGNVVFSTLGSSVTSGVGVKSMEEHWTGLLVKDLMQTQRLDKLDFHNNGYPGITTTKVLSEQRVEEVIAQKPDLILFETCLLNDYHYAVPLDKTITNIDEIMGKFQKELPDTIVILQSPNPRDPGDANKLGTTYQNYLDKTKEHILSKGWRYIDVASAFEAQRTGAGLKTTEVMPDGVHPNEKGSKYWYNTVREYFFKQPQ